MKMEFSSDQINSVLHLVIFHVARYCDTFFLVVLL